MDEKINQFYWSYGSWTTEKFNKQTLIPCYGMINMQSSDNIMAGCVSDFQDLLRRGLMHHHHRHHHHNNNNNNNLKMTRMRQIKLTTTKTAYEWLQLLQLSVCCVMIFVMTWFTITKASSNARYYVLLFGWHCYHWLNIVYQLSKGTTLSSRKKCPVLILRKFYQSHYYYL